MNTKNWTTWCLIWQRPIKGKQIQRRPKVVLHKLQVMEQYIETRTAKLKMHGSRKKSWWGRNLKKLLWTSWKVELLNKIELQELESLRRDSNSKEIQIMIVIWIQMISNLMLMLILGLLLLSTQDKFSSILNKLKKQNKWLTEKWNSSEKIGFTQVTEIESIYSRHSLKRLGSMMTNKFINLNLVSLIMVYHQIEPIIIKVGMMVKE